MKANDRFVLSLVAGMAGGTLLAAFVLAVVAANGGLALVTKTITVQESPILPATGSNGRPALTGNEVYRQDASGVVFINATDVTVPQSPGEFLKGEGGERGAVTGSGFEIDADGMILTNWHLVDGAAKVKVRTERGEALYAQVIGDDPSNDLALLRVAPMASSYTRYPV